MLPILYKFFIINRKVILPSVGVFYLHRQVATFDFSRQVFKAPIDEIKFVEDQHVADDSFFRFVSMEQKIEENVATDNFRLFYSEVFSHLQMNKQVKLPGFGLLWKGSDGKLAFEPQSQLPCLFADVAAERTIGVEVATDMPENVPEQPAVNEWVMPSNYTKTNNYWWVISIVIALAAIAAIGYYYYLHGSFQ